MIIESSQRKLLLEFREQKDATLQFGDLVKLSGLKLSCSTFKSSNLMDFCVCVDDAILS